MTAPDWDVATIIRDLMQNDPNDFGDVTGVPTIPDDRVVLANTEATKGVDWTQEYVLIRETGERGKAWRYLNLSAYDADAFVTLETATPASRPRREEIWSEIEQIGTDNRKRRDGLPGNWGWLEVDGVPIDDEAFNFWAMEVGFAFHKRAEPV